MREETLARANTFLVDYHRTLLLAADWGGGEIASMDSLRFKVPVHTLNAGYNYPHGLHDHKPIVLLRNTANWDVSAMVRRAWPSEHEVAITFAEPPPVGSIYQVEFVAS